MVLKAIKDKKLKDYKEKHVKSAEEFKNSKDVKEKSKDFKGKIIKDFRMDKKDKKLKDYKLAKDKDMKGKSAKQKFEKAKDAKSGKHDKVIKSDKKEKELKVLKQRKKLLSRANRQRRRAGSGNEESYTSYVGKVLKSVHDPPVSISAGGMQLLDNIVRGLFDRMSEESVRLLRVNGQKTLSAQQVGAAARLLLGGSMCRLSLHEGNQAVMKFRASDESRMLREAKKLEKLGVNVLEAYV